MKNNYSTQKQCGHLQHAHGLLIAVAIEWQMFNRLKPLIKYVEETSMSNNLDMLLSCFPKAGIAASSTTSSNVSMKRISSSSVLL